MIQWFLRNGAESVKGEEVGSCNLSSKSVIFCGKPQEKGQSLVTVRRSHSSLCAKGGTDEAGGGGK